MKTVKQKARQEHADFFCDVCAKPAISHFKFIFGYGSDFDLQYLEGDFCNGCGKSFRAYILRKFKNIKPKEYCF